MRPKGEQETKFLIDSYLVFFFDYYNSLEKMRVKQEQETKFLLHYQIVSCVSCNSCEKNEIKKTGHKGFI